jgi:hypothetical protein
MSGTDVVEEAGLPDSDRDSESSRTSCSTCEGGASIQPLLCSECECECECEYEGGSSLYQQPCAQFSCIYRYYCIEQGSVAGSSWVRGCEVRAQAGGSGGEERTNEVAKKISGSMLCDDNDDNHLK